jgi:hypothetical protein
MIIRALLEVVLALRVLGTPLDGYAQQPARVAICSAVRRSRPRPSSLRSRQGCASSGTRSGSHSLSRPQVNARVGPPADVRHGW